MNLKELAKAIGQIAEEKKIDKNKVLEAVEASLAAAYKKEYGLRGGVVKAKLDLETGNTSFWQTKIVVDENTVRIIEEEEEGEAVTQDFLQQEEDALPRYNPEKHILLEEAKKIKENAELEEEIIFPLPAPEEDFGRIAAQTAKQNILQKLREIERDSIINEYKDREGMIVSGVVRRFERGNVFVDLGRAEGIMFGGESVQGEHYRIGERLKFYVETVQNDSKGANVVLSRIHPKFISKLFETEVPEIAEGTVEIKAIAREAGSRTKIAVHSKDENIDAVGSFVGQRGTRVMAVNNEVGQEKLDIIEWSEDPEKYVANSISPAKVSRIEMGGRREARIFVPEDQLSLAIGRGGQNVRLAAKLTGWKIDVRSEKKPEEEIEGGKAEGITIEETVKKEEEIK